MTFLDLDQARAFVTALTGSPDTICDFRAIHDVDKGRPANAVRGTLAQAGEYLERLQGQGFGLFMMINASDGQGRDIANIVSVRAHFIDYDGADASWSSWGLVNAWDLPPTFLVTAAVPGKYHAYWVVEPYAANDGVGGQRFEMIQRKLVTKWQSDPPVIDLPRVMRLPGSTHLKDPANPVRVTMVPGANRSYKVGQLEWQLADISASGGGAERVQLGDASKAAPSFEWAVYALNRIDPGTLDRAEWLKLTAAFKTASVAHAGEVVSRFVWDQWCAKFPGNDLAENEKLWNSIRDTKTGWSHLERTAGVAAERMFGGANALPVDRAPVAPRMADGAALAVHSVPEPGVVSGTVAAPVPSAPVPKSDEERKAEQAIAGSDFLTPSEQAIYFKGCVLIENMGRILTPSGRFMDASKFNAAFGGKQFILSDGNAKATDEAWKAATRGQAFRVPKVDSVRFLPYMPAGEVFTDELGRQAVNTYKKPNIVYTQGDVTPFLDHLAKLFPIERDVKILLSYMAHCVQRPGRKAMWAPVIQSAEGAGKNVFKFVMTYALGTPYVYTPKSQQLVESGGKFNAWMRGKLLIIADEIRVDEKREMIEILKDLITEDRVEIQGKGTDQDVEDNVANWMMFTNWQDAIPISLNQRRYAIFYSQVQRIADFHRLGMVGDYFPKLYGWIRSEGAGHVAQYLLNYLIPDEFDPMGAAHRAPATSSTVEALAMSRTRLEQVLAEAIEGGEPGFRGGWLSSTAVQMKIKAEKLTTPSPHNLKDAFERLGFTLIGRANRAYPLEEFKQPNLYNRDPNAHVGDYSRLQGYPD